MQEKPKSAWEIQRLLQLADAHPHHRDADGGNCCLPAGFQYAERSAFRGTRSAACRWWGMRWIVVCLLFVLPAQILAAPGEPEGPRDYTKKLDKENIEFLRNLTIMVEAKGFKNVQIIPQMFVATAKKADGTEVTVIIDYNTLEAYPVDGTALHETKHSLPETVVPQMR